MKNKAKQEKRKPSNPEREKTFNIIISIITALLLWAYVISQVNPSTTQVIDNVPVELLNLQSLTSRELAVAGSTEYTVDVVIEGTRADIAALDEKEIIAQADLFGWSEGTNYIPVTVEVPEEVDLVEIRSDKIEVNIETLIAVSKPVEIVYTGTLSEDSEVGGVEIKPEQIEITGAKSDVQEIDKVQVPIAIESLTEEGSIIQAEVIPVNQAGVAVDNVNLSAVYVDVFAAVYELKEVALDVSFVGSPGDGYGAETKVPDTIWIKGPASALKEIETVATADVDLAEIPEGGTVALSVILPEKVELSSRNQDLTAGIEIVEVGSKTFTYSSGEIFLEGLTKGRSVNMDTTSVEVTISANKELIGDISEEDLKLYIDVTDAAVGEQTARIYVDSDASLQGVTVTPEKISITVKTADAE